VGKMSKVLERKGRLLKEPAPSNAVALPQAKPEPAASEEHKATPAPPPPEPAAKAKPFRLPTRKASRRPTDREKIEEERERLVSYFAPASPQGKRIDILRSQLLYPFHGDTPRTIMITSAVPREGRSLLAANLAISFARGLQQFVILMDCNLMEPTIHNLLAVPRRPGLSDYLESQATVPQIIHHSRVDKLQVIPAGEASERSAEILATDKMAALVEELRARYHDRYIILDTPPVQAVDDPAVLARMVEGIVFVVLSGSTDREVAMRSLGRLPEEKIIGIVLNDKLSAVSDAGNVAAIKASGEKS